MSAFHLFNNVAWVMEWEMILKEISILIFPFFHLFSFFHVCGIVRGRFINILLLEVSVEFSLKLVFNGFIHFVYSFSHHQAQLWFI